MNGSAQIRIREIAAALLAVIVLLFASAAIAQTRTVPCTNYNPFTPQAQFPWMGDSNAQNLTVISKASDACLNAVLYTPAQVPHPPMPAVVMALGATGDTENLGFAARYLAGNGYLVLIVAQQGQGGSEQISPSLCGTPTFPTELLDDGERLSQVCPGLPPDFNIDIAEDAIVSGIDYLMAQDQYEIDLRKIGAAGHSEGARGAAAAQMDDSRISTIVAFDNLSSDRSGDEGVCSGGQPQSALTGGQVPDSSYPITPKVPAMGQACDNNVGKLPPDAKEFAFNKWYQAGLPSAEIVFKGWNHLAWAGTALDSYNGSADVQHQIAAYYALAWFDAYLRHDSTGITRLLAPTISMPNGAADGTSMRGLLSVTFHSGVYLPNDGPHHSTIYCDDLLDPNCNAIGIGQ